jgi:hypothetical protein
MPGRLKDRYPICPIYKDIPVGDRPRSNHLVRAKSTSLEPSV